jgi:hypothetical protein
MRPRRPHYGSSATPLCIKMLKLNALADLLRNAYKRYRLGHDVTAVTAGCYIECL